MTPSTQFSSGLQLGPFITSAGILLRSWSAITTSNHASTSSNVGVRLSWNVLKDSDNDLTIIAFEAATVSNLQPDWVPYSDFKDKNFKFLGTEKSPFLDVKLNKAAVDLFYDNHQKLDDLKSQITSSTPLIVTGQALGGSVAILFTLSLLNNIGSGKNRPLCITFGSPLIGDKKLQQVISRSATWNSCFLQVVNHKDPLPRLFIKSHTSAAAGTSSDTPDYMPFGTFLFCSDGSSTCFESPDSILQLLKTMASIHDQNQGFQSAEYGNIVKNLNVKAICKDLTAHGGVMTDYSSLRASISLQLWALELTPNMQIRQQQQQQNSTLVAVMEEQEEKFKIQKKSRFEPTKKLNNTKIHMVQLEWYKKDSRNQNIGYYDSYKNKSSRQDMDVDNFRTSLTKYWEKMVEEAEIKPQKEGAAFRTRWLYAGTNYRRMVEPLDIADYYINGGKDYLKNRYRHYIQLEKWLTEGTTTSSGSSSTSSRDVESILTFDSCFWAHVEEALLSCELVNDEKSSAKDKEDAKQKLLRFEDYVYGLLKNYEVSSEIFLNGSSYMLWWREYKVILGTENNSKLASFMSNAVNYNERYVKGTNNFS